MIREASLENETPSSSESNVSSKRLMYARLATGELVLRLGVDHPCEGVTMLDTGEPVYAPITQVPCLFLRAGLCLSCNSWSYLHSLCYIIYLSTYYTGRTFTY